MEFTDPENRHNYSPEHTSPFQGNLSSSSALNSPEMVDRGEGLVHTRHLYILKRFTLEDFLFHCERFYENLLNVCSLGLLFRNLGD